MSPRHWLDRWENETQPKDDNKKGNSNYFLSGSIFFLASCWSRNKNHEEVRQTRGTGSTTTTSCNATLSKERVCVLVNVKRAGRRKSPWQWGIPKAFWVLNEHMTSHLIEVDACLSLLSMQYSGSFLSMKHVLMSIETRITLKALLKFCPSCHSRKPVSARNPSNKETMSTSTLLFFFKRLR